MVGNYDFYGHRPKDEDVQEPFVGRVCYVFNRDLSRELNDTRCIHCANFMTLQCEHIEEFIKEG